MCRAHDKEYALNDNIPPEITIGKDDLEINNILSASNSPSRVSDFSLNTIFIPHEMKKFPGFVEVLEKNDL